MSPLAADHSNLPRPERSSSGWAPDPEPRFVHLLAEQWAARDALIQPKPRATATARFRHSDAGACARSIAYSALNLPASDPVDITGTWNMGLGTVIHELWQEAILAKYPTARIEPKVTSIDGEGAGHIDAVFPDGKVIAFELKTIGGFGFKMAIGERGDPQGPKSEHVTQAALNGKAVDADEIVIGYLSKEAVSVNAAKRKHLTELGRFCAEWTLGRDEYEPIAAAEEARVSGILGLLDQGTLPARKIPSPELPTGAEITDPTKGMWQLTRDDKILDAGTFWACGYCRYQTMCAQTPSGRIPTDTLVQLGVMQ